MMDLPGGKTLMISTTVSIQYQSVTDRQTYGQTVRILLSISHVNMATRDKNLYRFRVVVVVVVVKVMLAHSYS